MKMPPQTEKALKKVLNADWKEAHEMKREHVKPLVDLLGRAEQMTEEIERELFPYTFGADEDE